MIRAYVIDDPQTGGKRKLVNKDDDDDDGQESTLDKLADLDLESDEEEELKITLDDEDDILSLCEDIRPGRGHGRGRGRVRPDDFKRSPAKFRQYRDLVRSPVEEVPQGTLRTWYEDVVGKGVEKEGQQEATGSAGAPKDDLGGTSAAGAKGEVLPEVKGTESGVMCQMKWMRTVAVDSSGKIKCCVTDRSRASSVAGSETGKTESLQADTIRNLTNIYVKKRGEIAESNGIVPTPVHVVKKLALENGETLHCEITKFCSGRHRVEMFSGSLRGLGEGVTKRIAAQMACIDLLERIQLSGGTVKVPTVAFLPGWLTSNRIFSDLDALCKARGLPRMTLVSGPNQADEEGNFDPKRPPYRAECWVGEDLVTVGESEAEIFAKREAARQMYQLIATEEYKDTPYAIGQACQSAAELASAGHKQILSDYKKVWLLQHRVENKQLVIPEEEIGFDDPIDVVELEKDMETVAESASYKLMKKNTIKVTLNNKKKRLALENIEEDSESTVKRNVSVEAKNDADDW